MKLDIILSGVGGQGILSIAAIIGEAALEEKLHIKQAEVHGMSQRGGDVQSNLRISSEPIRSDLIARGGADLILSLEPMEALRYLPYLSDTGWIVTNAAPFVNIPNYPQVDDLLADLKRLPRVILLDVDALAKENNVPRAANVVLLGAASPILGIGIEKSKTVSAAFRTQRRRRSRDEPQSAGMRPRSRRAHHAETSVKKAKTKTCK